MKIDVKKIKELVHELSVEIPADVVNGELEQAFADVRRRTTLKGFRKGKAPLNLIKARYEEEVRADVADQLIRSSYLTALQEKQLKVASQPTVTDLKFEHDGVFRYTATVEVLPGIENVDFDNLEITGVEIKVEDKDVDEIAAYVRKLFADLRDVDREVQNGDVVVADLKKLYDPDLVLDQDLMTDVEIDLDRAYTVREFKEQLPGMKAGEEKEIEVVYDDDYPDPVFAGARIKYLCRVKAVKEPILPPFDDALARRTGKAETALELRLKLREDLNRQQHDQLRKIHKNQVVRQVVERNRIPVPEAMVNDYLDAMVADARQNDPGLDESEVRQSGREVAANTLRWNMLFHHIAGQEKIEVSPADTEQVIKSIADDHQVTPEQARQALERSGRLASLRDTMLEEKVLDFLVDRARVVSVDTGKKK